MFVIICVTAEWRLQRGEMEMLITFMLASGPSVDCPSLQAGLIFILLAVG